MAVIKVNLAENSYDIIISADRLPQIGSSLSQLRLGRKTLVVSTPEIFDYYGDIVADSLKNQGFEVIVHLIPAGEAHKTLHSIEAIYDTALSNYLERSSTAIALGGGVIGDMTGFAAATWLRGINFVQVPTSLLAMVDASIGGKTGVNHPKGKNLIGAFYQPQLVFIDPLVLKTLPDREFRAGMAEVIKYGVIWDAQLFADLEKAERLDKLEYLSEELLESIIERSAQAKVDVVTQDEKELGLRAILNYGHTLGHAVESLTGYQTVNHGEAVAIGMVLAGQIALELSMWTSAEAARQQALIEKAGLPTKIPPGLELKNIVATVKSDKKVKDSKVRFILPEAIGKACISDRVTSELIEKVCTQVSTS